MEWSIIRAKKTHNLYRIIDMFTLMNGMNDMFKEGENEFRINSMRDYLIVRIKDDKGKKIGYSEIKVITYEELIDKFEYEVNDLDAQSITGGWC